MKQNIANPERVIRGAVGVAVVAWGVYAQSWWGALGLIPITTAAMGWCPPYALFGFSTCKVKQSDA